MLGSLFQSAKALITKPIVTLMYEIANYQVPMDESWNDEDGLATTKMSMFYHKNNNSLEINFADCPRVYAKCEDFYQPQRFTFSGIKHCTDFSASCGHNYVIGEEWDFSKVIPALQEYYLSSQEKVISSYAEVALQANRTVSTMPTYEQLYEQVINSISNYFSDRSAENTWLSSLQEGSSSFFNQLQGVFQQFYSNLQAGSSCTEVALRANRTVSTPSIYERLYEQTINGIGNYFPNWSGENSWLDTLQSGVSSLFKGSESVFSNTLSLFQVKPLSLFKLKSCDWDDFSCHREVLSPQFDDCKKSNLNCYYEVLSKYAEQYNWGDVYSDFMQKYVPSQEEVVPYVALTATALVSAAGLYLLWRSQSQKPETRDARIEAEADELLKIALKSNAMIEAEAEAEAEELLRIALKSND